MLTRRLSILTLSLGIMISTALTGVQAAQTAAPQGPVAAETATGANAVMTFQAWKRQRVDEARMGLERVTFAAQLAEPPADRSPGIDRPAAQQKSRIQKSEGRIEQARLSLEIAQDLTANDYLQVYLAQFRSRDVLLDVARRMTPDDVVDVLLSYQKLSTAGEIAEHTITPAPRLLPRSL